VNFLFHGATTASGPGPPNVEDSQSHLFKHTTLGRTSLDEWSSHRRDYLTTHNAHDRHPCLPRGSNPQSQQASRRRTTP